MKSKLKRNISEGARVRYVIHKSLMASKKEQNSAQSISAKWIFPASLIYIFFFFRFFNKKYYSYGYILEFRYFKVLISECNI